MFQINHDAEKIVSTNEVYCPNSLTSTKGYKFYDVDFDKTYYAPINGALRAVRFVSFVMVCGCSTTFTYLKAKVARIDGYVGMSTNTIYTDSVKKYVGNIYASVEDYKNEIKVRLVEISPEQVFKYIFGNTFTYVSNSFYRERAKFYGSYKFACYRYAWDGTKVVYACNEIIKAFNERVEIFKDKNVYLGFSEKNLSEYVQLFSNSYATIEDCKKDNEIKVAEFDDANAEKTEKVCVIMAQVPLESLDKLSSIGVVVF